jgi:hypothetical protein
MVVSGFRLHVRPSVGSLRGTRMSRTPKSSGRAEPGVHGDIYLNIWGLNFGNRFTNAFKSNGDSVISCAFDMPQDFGGIRHVRQVGAT